MSKIKIVPIVLILVLVLIISGCSKKSSDEFNSAEYNLTFLSSPIKINHSGNLTYTISNEDTSLYDFYNLFIAETIKIGYFPSNIQVVGEKDGLVGINDFRPTVQIPDGEKRYSILSLAIPKNSDIKTYNLLIDNEYYPLNEIADIEPITSGNVAPGQLFLLQSKDTNGNRLEMLGVFCSVKHSADMEDKLYNKTKLELVFLGMPKIYSDKNPRASFAYSKINGDVIFLYDTSRDSINPNEFIAFSYDDERSNRMDARGGVYLLNAIYSRRKTATTEATTEAFLKKDFSFILESLTFTSPIQ